MPIRLNLLAEAQAAEDMRRRDPVKRTTWIAGLLVGLTLAWSGWLQLQAILAGKDLNRVEAILASHTNDYQQVIQNQRKIAQVEDNLSFLRQLATNRFLYGNLLNALQQTSVDDVQLLRLKVAQEYLLNEETKPKTNGSRVVPGKPATMSERIALTLDGRAAGDNPRDQVNKFKSAIASHAYFVNMLGKTNEVRLASFSPPQANPDGRPFILFTLECRFPEHAR